jgi:hypothetical protein
LKEEFAVMRPADASALFLRDSAEGGNFPLIPQVIHHHGKARLVLFHASAVFYPLETVAKRASFPCAIFFDRFFWGVLCVKFIEINPYSPSFSPIFILFSCFPGHWTHLTLDGNMNKARLRL